ncbi:hypothetical protein GW17_00057145 [Ensete ventricosum]|nr:hypothetical protein GW17_00057145 [Ensete ventricosum]
MVSMSMMRGNPRTGWGCSGAASSILASAPPSPLAPHVESGLVSEVQEIPVKEARGVPEVSHKRRGEDPVSQRKKDRLKPPTLRRKPKLVRELCSASARVDGRDYHAIRMCNLPEKAPDAPLEVDLRPLTHVMLVWQNGEASAKYIQVTLIPRLTTDLYTLPSKVLMDGAAKAMVLAALFDRVHDAGWVITSLDSKVNLLCQEVQGLKEGGDPDAVAVAEVRASEAQSLVEHLRVELDEARHPGVEIELDPFASLPEDDDAPMADEQPFDDSLPSLEE